MVTQYNRTILSTIRNTKTLEFLLGSAHSNFKLRIFGCAAYVNTDKATRNLEMTDHTEHEVYLGRAHDLHRIHLLQVNRVVHSKFVALDECKLSAESKNQCTVLERERRLIMHITHRVNHRTTEN